MERYKWSKSQTQCTQVLRPQNQQHVLLVRNNNMAKQLQYVFDQYRIDIMGLQEVCINWSKFKSSQTLALLLRHGSEAIRSAVSSDKNEELKNLGRYQRGGMSTIIRVQLAGFVVDSGVDSMGLGHWLW